MNGRALVRLLLCLVLGGCLLLGAFGIAPARADTFSDVPDTYWAYQWIEFLASARVIFGYSDGTYRPEGPVTRGQMAAFIGRAMQETARARCMGITFMPSGDVNELVIVAPAARDEVEYRLYEGSDGITYSVSSALFLGYCFTSDLVWWRLSGVTDTRYFKPVAVVSGREHQLCGPVVGRPGPVPHTIVITAPPVSGASRLPTVAWDPVPGAAAYLAFVSRLSVGSDPFYFALVDASRTSVWFGHTSGPGFMAAWRGVDMLDPNTTYRAGVVALDASGAFLMDNDMIFTTGL